MQHFVLYSVPDLNTLVLQWSLNSLFSVHENTAEKNVFILWPNWIGISGLLSVMSFGEFRIQTLYTVDHELPVLSLYLYSHNKVFADINQNNIAQ